MKKSQRNIVRDIALVNIKTARVTRPYVYIVYSCDNGEHSGVIEGVYINKEEAEGKRDKLLTGYKDQWIAVLKKPLHGKNALEHNIFNGV